MPVQTSIEMAVPASPLFETGYAICHDQNMRVIPAKVSWQAIRIPFQWVDQSPIEGLANAGYIYLHISTPHINQILLALLVMQPYSSYKENGSFTISNRFTSLKW